VRGVSPSQIVTVRWIVPPADNVVAMELRSLLDDDERKRADRFRFDADRNSYITAHALLRSMLSRQCGIAPPEWRFRIEPGGKPEIDPAHGQPSLRFSLSHTHCMAACAVGRTHDLGVDVEVCRTAVPVVDLARKYFAPAEANLIADLPPPQQRVMFYRIWTLKEAYLKATGTGIAAPLDGFSFALDPVSINFITAGADRPEAWQFAEFQPGPRHRLALAVHCPAASPVQIDLAAGD
jgi:4'-phosphopantetheinyl transferase